MAYLVDHPPARRQYRSPRRQDPSGVCVVHTAESTPDTLGADMGAENVAAFIARRSDPGSYHDLCDSDSVIQLVRYSDEAFHDGTGSNPHSYGVSGATQASKWNQLPKDRREAMVRNMALGASRYAKWLKAKSGITIPARRISRAQSEAKVPGFISHGERDPGRRTDPGATFPWSLFLLTYAALMGGNDEGEAMATAKEIWQYRNDKVEQGDVFGLLVEAYRRAGSAEALARKAAEDSAYARLQNKSIAAGVSALASALLDGKVDPAELKRVTDGLSGKS